MQYIVSSKVEKLYTFQLSEEVLKELKKIMRDYMRTNRTCFFKNFWIFIGVVLVTFSVRKAHNLNLLLSSRRSFLDAAFDEIDRVWNGTEGFLHNALKLSDEDISELREIYLV
jgi:hypothetical protein